MVKCVINLIENLPVSCIIKIKDFIINGMEDCFYDP